MSAAGQLETDPRLLIDAVAQERRVALLQGHRLERLWIDRGGPVRFDIHVGRVAKMLPGMAAAMVALEGGIEGLLPLDRIDGPLHEGQWVIVQVSRLGFEDKGPKLTGRISMEGVGLIFRPRGGVIDIPRKIKDADRRDHLHKFLKSIADNGESITVRSLATGWTDAALRGEFNRLRAIWHGIAEVAKNPDRPIQVFRALSDVDQIIERHLMAGVSCIVDGTDEYIRLRGFLKARDVGDAHLQAHRDASLLFEAEGIESQIDAALAPRVDLAQGAWIAIEPTTALTAIDVNGGAAQSGTHPPARVVEINCDAAREIVHQIRLRNIGGLVVIDPLRMAGRADRDAFETALRDAFGRELDGAVQLGGFTRLGLYEFTRQRSGVSLYHTMFEADGPQYGARIALAAAINAVLRGIVAQMRCQHAGNYRLTVHPRVIDAFRTAPRCQKVLSDAIGAMPEMTGDADLAMDGFVLERI
jgi:Rne/Rng family ribonuclease